MAKCKVDIEVAASREQTFAYLADASNQPEWRPDVKEDELVSGTPGTVGATWKLRLRGEECNFRITDVEGGSVAGRSGEDGSSISWMCAEDTSWPVKGTYRLSEREDGGTRITMDLEMTPTGVWFVFRPLVPLLVKATRKRYERGLHAALGKPRG